MKKNLLLIFICCLLAIAASAQYNTNRNKIWAFGNNAGLDFTSGTPVPFTSSINTLEGCASVCNTAGQLLFYTNGQIVYNRLGLSMPNGSSIVPFPTNSTSQAALIIPVINDSSRYYIFSLESMGSAGQLTYSIVDMTLGGGLGDIVPGSTGVVIDTGMSEKMIAIPGQACNMWLMTHQHSTQQFFAYEITSAGINTIPVVSNVGTFTGIDCYEMGVMKCSPDRQKIVAASQQIPGSVWGLELFDFDPATGIVSNCRVLDLNPAGSGDMYGAEFSPDNSKVYAGSSSAYQWDISLPSTAAIVASKTALSVAGTYYGDMKLAPDGKIYVARFNTNILDCINAPNVAGVGCGYIPNAITMATGATTLLGLPNLVWTTNSISAPPTICTGATTTFTAYPGGGTWTSSNTSIATIGSSSGIISGISPGTAVITYSVGSCATTTVVTVNPILSMADSVCLGSTITLSAGSSGGTWSSSNTSVATVGSLSGIVTALAVGTTSISYGNPGQCLEITNVTVNPLPAPITGLLTVALGGNRTYTCSTAGGTWSSGDTTIAKVNSSGKVSGLALGTATIYYTLPTGCRVSIVINVVKNTALAGLTGISKPTVYPNPANNEITIKSEYPAYTTFIIYNSVGQEVINHNITTSEMKVNVKTLAPGEYRAVFKGDGVSETVQLVKW